MEKVRESRACIPREDYLFVARDAIRSRRVRPKIAVFECKMQNATTRARDTGIKYEKDELVLTLAGVQQIDNRS